jgi:5'-3' exonuclease
VFDHNQNPNEDFHNPAKVQELYKRKEKKDKAIKEMNNLIDEPLFSDDDEEEPASNSHKDKISTLEKQAFTASKAMLDDIKYILTCLNIKYIEAPAGYEGEAIASFLNENGTATAVLSGDTDPVLYGAKILYRRNPKDKKLYEYKYDDLLQQIKTGASVFEPNYSHLLKIALALGTDMSPKTPGIGAATVFKRIHIIELSEEQEAAKVEFTKRPTMELLKIWNKEAEAFVNDQRKVLIDWLVNERSFNRTRMENAFAKLDKPAVVKRTVRKKAPAVESEEPQPEVVVEKKKIIRMKKNIKKI